MATLSQIADEYGVSKSTARRWVMDCMPEVFNGKKLDLSKSQMHVLANFVQRTGKAPNVKTSNGSTVYSMNSPEMRELMRSELLELSIENARLTEKIESLNTELKLLESSRRREIELLVSRVEAAEAALRREQETHQGFWSRLGQRLLKKPEKNSDF